jgi:hypothetical protein
MKKTTLFTGLVIVLTSINSFAQSRQSLRAQNAATQEPASMVQPNNANTTMPLATTPIEQPAQAPVADNVPVVTLGTIQTSTSTREQILRYPRLLPQALDYEVKSFSFALKTGNVLWGPVNVKGAVLTEEIKDKIKEAEGSKMAIYIDNITVSYKGQGMTAKHIAINFDR